LADFVVCVKASFYTSVLTPLGGRQRSQKVAAVKQNSKASVTAAAAVLLLLLLLKVYDKTNSNVLFSTQQLTYS